MHIVGGGLFSKSRFHSGLSLKADNGGHPRCDTQLPAACCPGALHAAVCKQASSQRPVLSAQTMQRYSARINAFILLQTYYNSRRGVSQAFDSPARLVLHWAKMQPGGFIMQLITERLFLIPLQPDGMRALLARTTDPELIQPYTDMLNLSLAHPEQWVWYTAWGLYQNDSGDWQATSASRACPKTASRKLAAAFCRNMNIRATPPRLSAPPAAGPSNSPASPPSRPRRPDHAASQAVLHRVGFVPTGTVGAEGRGLFCAKSLDSIAKSALSPLHLPQLVP